MKKSFFNFDKPLLTAMIQTREYSYAVETSKRAIESGADAIGLQVCKLKEEYRTEKNFRDLFEKFCDTPFYVTNYRTGLNGNKTDEEIADTMRLLAKSKASLIDVMGDLYSRDEQELTKDEKAIDKQKRLIDEIHNMGAKVLMSSHPRKFLNLERVVEMACDQQSRGADYVKIVTWANNEDEEIENLRITNELKKELKVPFLFLSGGTCHIHRMIGPYLGCSMFLCVYEHNELSTKDQPELKKLIEFTKNF